MKEIKGYYLTSKRKLESAVNRLAEKGKKEPTDLELLTEYDRLEGVIYTLDELGQQKQSNGTFWDFDKQEPIKKPKIVKPVKEKKVIKKPIILEFKTKKGKTVKFNAVKTFLAKKPKKSKKK